MALIGRLWRVAMVAALTAGTLAVTPRASVAQEAVSRSELPMVPNVAATALLGKRWSLRELRGYPVILTLFATWCPPSRDQLKELDTLQRRYGRRGLIILAVSSESRETLTRYVTGHGLSVPMLTDPNDSIMQTLGLSGYPSTIFIGRDGRALTVASGTSPELTPVLAALAEHELAARASLTAARRGELPERTTRRRLSRASRAPSKQKRLARTARARGSQQARKAGAGDGVLMLSNTGAKILR